MRNIERKEHQSIQLMEGMVRHMKEEMQKNVRGSKRNTGPVRNCRRTDGKMDGPAGRLCRRDTVSCVGIRGLLDFQPAILSLYTYSNSERDMGNSKDYAEFEAHFRFLVSELFRVTKDGRLLSFHCMNLPISKQMEGFIGIRDFRGELIRMFVEAGWIYHSEVCIWKDPVTAMQRTKALGLLYKQLRKDSCMKPPGDTGLLGDDAEAGR